MKSRSLIPLLIAGFPVAIVLAQDLPKPLDIARYQGMLERSPFAVATAVAAPAATPNFAKDLYVANAARSKDGDLVTIASSADKNFKKYLRSNEPSDGYSITGIEWSEKVGATKVTISKDGQTATLTFNEALLRQPLASGQQPQAPQQPVTAQPVVPAPNPAAQQQQQQQQQPNVQKPMPVPSLPTPPPRVRGVIPRNPVPNTTPYPVPQPTANQTEPEL